MHDTLPSLHLCLYGIMLWYGKNIIILTQYKCRDYVVTNEKWYDNYDWSAGKY